MKGGYKGWPSVKCLERDRSGEAIKIGEMRLSLAGHGVVKLGED